MAKTVAESGVTHREPPHLAPHALDLPVPGEHDLHRLPLAPLQPHEGGHQPRQEGGGLCVYRVALLAAREDLLPVRPVGVDLETRQIDDRHVTVLK